MARTVLDSQLQLLDAQLLVMASSTEDALRMSIAALAARDAEAANAVIDGDDDIDRQERDVEQYRRLQSRPLPLDLDYNEVDSLRLEARQKLNAVKPLNFGQAARISGVSPADITALMIYIETHRKGEKA